MSFFCLFLYLFFVEKKSHVYILCISHLFYQNNREDRSMGYEEEDQSKRKRLYHYFYCEILQDAKTSIHIKYYLIF